MASSRSRAVILATGNLIQKTGSTETGMASRVGHTGITPSLQQKFRLTSGEEFIKGELRALSLRNVALSVLNEEACCDASDEYDFHAFWVSGQPSYVVQASCIRSAGEEGK